mmetsp:Transcript_54024/g.80607  ORF Transcript_54024/g.80607 Transcript_54024/m.80607 type:complete len:189 (-) Transcript_54024:256-822(-)
MTSTNALFCSRKSPKLSRTTLRCSLWLTVTIVRSKSFTEPSSFVAASTISGRLSCLMRLHMMPSLGTIQFWATVVSTVSSHRCDPIFGFNLKRQVTSFVESCDSFQRHEFPAGPGLGHLPPKNDVAQPWEEVAADLVGPWKIVLPSDTLMVNGITILDIIRLLSLSLSLSLSDSNCHPLSRSQFSYLN